MTAAFSVDFALQEPLPGPPEPFLGESGGNVRLPSIPEQPILEVGKSVFFWMGFGGDGSSYL